MGAIEVKMDLNEKSIISKVCNDRVGLYISKTWKDLLDPFVPRNEGNLMNNVTTGPHIIHYNQEYATKMYIGTYGAGRHYKYKHINPYSTDHWDIKAEQAGKKELLYQSINNFINR